MKLFLFVFALFALAISLTTATSLTTQQTAVPIDGEGSEPQNQLYAVVFGIKDINALVDRVLAAMLEESEVPTTDEVPDSTALLAFERTCVKGAIAITTPNMEDIDISKLDIDPKKFQDIDFTNLADPKVQKKLKDLFRSVLSKISFEAKIFFVSDAVTMALPECQQSKIEGFFEEYPEYQGMFQIVKYQAIPAESYESCVKTDESTGQSTPVCGNYDQQTQPEEYQASNHPNSSLPISPILIITCNDL